MLLCNSRSTFMQLRVHWPARIKSRRRFRSSNEMLRLLSMVIQPSKVTDRITADCRREMANPLRATGNCFSSGLIDGTLCHPASGPSLFLPGLDSCSLLNKSFMKRAGRRIAGRTSSAESKNTHRFGNSEANRRLPHQQNQRRVRARIVSDASNRRACQRRQRRQRPADRPS